MTNDISMQSFVDPSIETSVLLFSSTFLKILCDLLKFSRVQMTYVMNKLRYLADS